MLDFVLRGLDLGLGLGEGGAELAVGLVGSRARLRGIGLRALRLLLGGAALGVGLLTRDGLFFGLLLLDR